MVNLEKNVALLADFTQQYPKKFFKAGDVLIRTGDKPADILCISNGKVHQIDISPSGNEIVVNVFAEPALISVFWMFEQNESRYTYKAVSDVTVRVIPRESLQAFMLQNPPFMYETLHRVVRGLDGFVLRMTYQMYGSAEKKTAVELLFEAKRFHKAETENVRLTSSINDITARTGLARETVSRQITRLKNRGLIEKNKNKISICSVAELEKFVTN